MTKEVFYQMTDLCAKDILTAEETSQIKQIIDENKLDFTKAKDSETLDAMEVLVSVVAYRGHIRLLEFFIQQGLNVRDDATALDGAAGGKRLECVELLLNNGADPRSIKYNESYHNSAAVAAILDQRIEELEMVAVGMHHDVSHA